MRLELSALGVPAVHEVLEQHGALQLALLLLVALLYIYIDILLYIYCAASSCGAPG